MYKLCIYFFLYRHEKLQFKNKLYTLREERDIKPSAFSNLVSTTLYGKNLIKIRKKIWSLLL
jgi:hypothetical protein